MWDNFKIFNAGIVFKLGIEDNWLCDTSNSVKHTIL